MKIFLKIPSQKKMLTICGIWSNFKFRYFKQLFCKIKWLVFIFLIFNHYCNVVLLRTKRKAKNNCFVSWNVLENKYEDWISMFFTTLFEQTEIKNGKLQLFCKLKCLAIIFLLLGHYCNVVLLQNKRKAKKQKKTNTKMVLNGGEMLFSQILYLMF